MDSLFTVDKVDLWYDKKGIVARCIWVSHNVCTHQPDVNEGFEWKARLLNKDTSYFFEQILDKATQK